MQELDPVYFKGFKFIRFLAASLVIIHHIEQYKAMFNISNYWSNESIRNLGGKGVTLFFVLSGFLITYLLLKEKEKTTTINIKYFYLRRILRIWPLYFLIALSALFVFPEINFFKTNSTSIIEQHFSSILVLTFLILPNVILFKYGAIPFSSQAWSIGVEEQFYLVWPVLIKYAKNVFLILVSIISLLFLLQNATIIIPKLVNPNFYTMSFLENTSTYLKFFRIDCMAFGSIGAILVYNKNKILNILFIPFVSISTLLVAVLILVNPYSFVLFDNLIQSFVFTLVIINIAVNANCKYVIENKYVNLLGDISYGLYMYHSIVAFTIIKLLGTIMGGYLLDFIILGITILISYLSYILFEKKIIKFKSQRFALIKSNIN